jgi:hypothetical protein
MKKQEKKHAALPKEMPEAGPKAANQTDALIPEERIRQRAYELHQARGSAPGQALDDWLQAERELNADLAHISDGRSQALNHASGLAKRL